MRNAKGLLAVFDHSDSLIDAARRVKRLHIRKVRAYTPFAVHGLDEALGLRRSWIPYVTLFMALAGAAFGFGFQSWTMSVAWPVNVGGKPMIAWPSFIPVTFETMILFSGVTTALIMLAMCWPFDFWRPSWDPRLSDDRFGLFIDESDAHYRVSELETIFKECDAKDIKTIH